MMGIAWAAAILVVGIFAYGLVASDHADDDVRAGYGDQVSIGLSISDPWGNVLMPPTPGAWQGILAPTNEPLARGQAAALCGLRVGEGASIELQPNGAYQTVRLTMQWPDVPSLRIITEGELLAIGYTPEQLARLQIGDTFVFGEPQWHREYGWKITGRDGGSFATRLVLEGPGVPGPLQDRSHQFAGTVRSSIQGGQVERHLEPIPSGVFLLNHRYLVEDVLPPDVQPGIYRHLGRDGDALRLARHTHGDLSTLFDTPVTIHLTVGTIDSATDVYGRAAGRHYGDRCSPHL